MDKLSKPRQFQSFESERHYFAYQEKTCSGEKGALLPCIKKPNQNKEKKINQLKIPTDGSAGGNDIK